MAYRARTVSPFFDRRELAQYLKVGLPGIDKLIRLRRIPFRKAGRKFLFDRDAVLAALDVVRLEEISK